METKESPQQLFELYKFYFELTDKTTQRRGKTNTFFLSVISSFIGLISFVSPFIDQKYKETPIYMICISGIILCFIWYININSYKQLNKLRFMVIQEMEENIIFPCFTREWQILKEKKLKYYRLTKIEKFIPLLFMIPFIFFFIITII